MEDYEIRDALRRATTPDLFVTLSFVDGERARFDYKPLQEISEPVRLLATIANRSPQPAHHTLVRIGIPTEITIQGRGRSWGLPQTYEDSELGRQQWLSQRITTPPDFPIFKEIGQPLDQDGIQLGFHSNFLARTYRWPVTIVIHTPGFSSIETWYIHQHGSNLRMLHPGHPLLR
jgi:hypothetical protein